MSLVQFLIEEGWLKTPEIIEAFKEIKRKDFLPAGIQHLAERNLALPIGRGQTISQPLVVAFMLELLKPNAGEKILDVGSGSGWTSTLLAYIVSQKEKRERGNRKQESRGKVIAMEIVPELKEFGKKNVSKYNFIEKGIVEFICADGSKGCEQEAPFDKILASAAIGTEKIPDVWKEQLKIKGKIVAPVGNSIWLFTKKNSTEFEEREYPGFVFVPLIVED